MQHQHLAARGRTCKRTRATANGAVNLPTLATCRDFRKFAGPSQPVCRMKSVLGANVGARGGCRNQRCSSLTSRLNRSPGHLSCASRGLQCVLGICSTALHPSCRESWSIQNGYQTCHELTYARRAVHQCHRSCDPQHGDSVAGLLLPATGMCKWPRDTRAPA